MSVQSKHRYPEILLSFFTLFYIILIAAEVKSTESKSILTQVAYGITSPILTTGLNTARWLSVGIDSYLDLRDVYKENIKLKRINRELMIRQYQIEEQKREINSIENLKSIELPEGWEGKVAHLTIPFTHPLSKIAFVDRGKGSLIRAGNGVVSTTGVVGVIIASTFHSSKIQLATDPNCTIAIVDKRSRVHGICQGEADHLIVRWISNEADVKLGDTFVTSGGDGFFPPGIPVGTVIDVRQGEDFIQKIHLMPATLSSTVDEIMVLVPPWNNKQ